MVGWLDGSAIPSNISAIISPNEVVFNKKIANFDHSDSYLGTTDHGTTTVGIPNQAAGASIERPRGKCYLPMYLVCTVGMYLGRYTYLP